MNFTNSTKDIGAYLDFIRLGISQVQTNGRMGVSLGEGEFTQRMAEMFTASCLRGGKLMFIGNGGSAAIAGHMALDFSNAGGLRAICFNDGVLLTCLVNDYGRELMFAQAIKMYANEGDTLVAISSSGQSENILRGVDAARAKKCSVVTLTGFDPENPLRWHGDLNLYVPVPRPHYGLVEMCHQTILHFVLDSIKKNPA